LQQRVDVDRSCEKAATILLERRAALGERAAGVADEQNVDARRTGNLSQPRNFFERAGRVDIQQDERGSLHRDARHEKRERHVDDDVAFLAQRRR